MANITAPSSWYKQRPGYAQAVNISNLDANQLIQLQTLLKNAGYYTGAVGDAPSLALWGALGNFQRTAGFGNTHPDISVEEWYALNTLSDAVANKRTNLDIGVWNTLMGARQSGIISVPDPNGWSYAPPGAIGVSPSNQTQGSTAPPQQPAAAPAQPPAGAAAAPQVDAFASMDLILSQYGLGAGSEFDLRDWAHSQATGPSYSPDVFKLNLMQTDAYKTRFGNVNQQRLASGLPALTPDQILEYEQGFAGIMQRVGAPASFYDNWRDYQSDLAEGTSLLEIQDRAEIAKQWTYGLPPEVKQAFAEVTGAGDLQSVWAYVLNPTKAAPLIAHQLQMAEIMGAGARFGIGVDQGMADTIANLGVDYGRAQQGFGQLDAEAALFQEGVGERDDLTVQQEGFSAVFGTGPGGAAALTQRAAARRASVEGGGGFERTRTGYAFGEAS